MINAKQIIEVNLRNGCLSNIHKTINDGISDAVLDREGELLWDPILHCSYDIEQTIENVIIGKLNV